MDALSASWAPESAQQGISPPASAVAARLPGSPEEPDVVDKTLGKAMPASQEAIGNELDAPVPMPAPPYVNIQVDLEGGEDAVHLDAILGEMDRRGWTAALYTTLDFAATYPELLSKAVSRGHEIGLLADMDLAGLESEEQRARLAEALQALRDRLGLPAEHPIHFRPVKYVLSYQEAVELLKALEAAGAASFSGVLFVQDDFSCPYCADNGRLMYPLITEAALKLVAIPVSVVGAGEDAVPLDDAAFAAAGPVEAAGAAAGAAAMFEAALARYESFLPPGEGEMAPLAEADYVHDKFTTIILHPSLSGVEEGALAAFRRLLDRIAQQSGTTVSNEQLVNLTLRVMAAGYIGSLSISKDKEVACPNSQVKLTVNWSAELYCPTYYFRIYGKYPSQSEWTLHSQASYYVRVGSYSFERTITVPEPPTETDTSYTIMVMGQSCSRGRSDCGYPTPSSYEAKATTSVSVPYVKVKEVKVSPTNPETTNELTLEVVLEAGGTSTSKVDWTIEPIGTRTWMWNTWHGIPYPSPIPVVKGTGTPFKYTPQGGTHGEKRVTALVIFKEGGQTCQLQKQKDFKLFFKKTGDEDNDQDPNWFEYWGPDGAVPEMTRSDVFYKRNAAANELGGYSWATDKIGLAPLAAGRDSVLNIPAIADSCPGAANLGGTVGIDTARVTVVHEAKHKEIRHNWDAGGTWAGQLDSDDPTPITKADKPADNLPDSYEISTTRTLTNVIDSCNLAGVIEAGYARYGDNEFVCRLTEVGVRGIADRDWAYPGKQSTPAEAVAVAALPEPAARSGPAALAASYVITEDVDSNSGLAEFTESYSDTGVDTDGDGLYNHLKLSVGVVVTQTAPYHVVAWLQSGTGTQIAWASTGGTLLTGTHAVELFFDGRVIRASGLNGPYNVVRVELGTTGGELLIDAANNAYTTTAYTYTSFDPYDVSFSGVYTDTGRDTDSDGLFNFLDIRVGLNVQAAGAYTVGGSLISAANPGAGYLVGVLTGTSFVTGTQNITLSFLGWRLRQMRTNGPCALVNLGVRNSAGELVAFVLEAYTTTVAYAYTDFQPGAAELTGSYSDAGVDTDGNGKYNYLRLSAGVNVITPSLYNLVGTLRDSQGNDITWASQSYTLTGGTQTATLDFDGLTIGSHGVNGPYTVTALSLLDSSGELLSFEPKVYTTTAYAYTDFEVGGIISGTVRNEASQVISGVVVFVSGPQEATAVTDANGQYVITHLPAGWYEVYAIPPTEAFLKEKSSSTSLSAGQTRVVDFTLEAAGGIAGRVTDENGNPLQAEIDLGGYEPPHYPTDEEGYYYIPGLSPGDYTVHISTEPAYNDWWIFVDGRHADNGAQVSVQVVEGHTTVVNFQRPPAIPVADLCVDKSVHAGVVGFDEDVTYRVRVRNLGNLAVSGIVVTDTLPTVATYVEESHPSGFTTVVTGSQTVWTKGSLPAYGQSGYEDHLYLTVHLADTLVAGDQVTNTLTSSSEVSEGDYNNNAYLYVQTAITPTRDLQISKWLYSGTPLPGGDIQYYIYLYNNGNSPAPNVRITDTLPLSTTYVSQQNYEGFIPQVIGNQVVWTNPSYAAGDYGYIYLTIHISDTVADGTVLTNTVQASTNRPETNYTNNVYTRTDMVQPRTRDMYVSKSLDSGKALAGAEVTYRVYVKNEGNTATADVVLTDTLPYSAAYVSSYNVTYFPSYAYNLFDPTVVGKVITWSLGTVPPNGYGYFYVTARISDTVAVGDALTNTAQVATSQVESDYNDNSSVYYMTIIAPTYDMYVYKSLYSGYASPGSDLTYQVYYQNYGNSPCQNVVITDTLPAEVSYVSWSGAFTPTVEGQQVTWNLGAVPGQYDPGYYGYLYLTAHVPEVTPVGTVLTNTVGVTTTSTETGVSSNSDTDVRTVSAPSPNLGVSKWLYYGQLVQGSETTYQIYYYNYSASAASNTAITDELPAGVSFVSATPITPTVQGNKLVWDLGTVPGYGYSGYYGDLYLNVYVADDVLAGTVLTNTVVITTPYDTYPANNQDVDKRYSDHRHAGPVSVQVA